jgi:hypothetical protein
LPYSIATAAKLSAADAALLRKWRSRGIWPKDAGDELEIRGICQFACAYELTRLGVSAAARIVFENEKVKRLIAEDVSARFETGKKLQTAFATVRRKYALPGGTAYDSVRAYRGNQTYLNNLERFRQVGASFVVLNITGQVRFVHHRIGLLAAGQLTNTAAEEEEKSDD